MRGYCQRKGDDTKFLMLFVYISVAAFFDKKEFRIPNWLCVAGVLNGLCYHFIVDGIRKLPNYFGGMLIPFFCLGILFYFHMLGAGDIKLFAVVGSFLGKDVIWIILYSMFINGIFAFFILYKEKAFIQRFRYFGEYVRTLFLAGESKPYCGDDWEKSPFVIHFTLGIWFAFLLYWIRN